jgi:hypothetical protein
MSGEVRELARIEPRMASLKGKSDTDVTILVKIFPVAVPDFNITDTTAGRFFDTVIMTTDTTPKREIRVRVFGDIQP